jgi:hypothetical protein
MEEGALIAALCAPATPTSPAPPWSPSTTTRLVVPSQVVVPLIGTAATPEVQAVLDAASSTLDTAALRELLAKVGLDGDDPAAVVRQWRRTTDWIADRPACSPTGRRTTWLAHRPASDRSPTGIGSGAPTPIPPGPSAAASRRPAAVAVHLRRLDAVTVSRRDRGQRAHQALWRDRRGRRPDLHRAARSGHGLPRPNGSGKSTTMRLLLQLDRLARARPPSAGSRIAASPPGDGGRALLGSLRPPVAVRPHHLWAVAARGYAAPGRGGAGHGRADRGGPPAGGGSRSACDSGSAWPQPSSAIHRR